MTDVEMAALERRIDALAARAEMLWAVADALARTHGTFSPVTENAVREATRATDARDAVSREYRIAVEA
jgi:hypothetical protein